MCFTISKDLFVLLQDKRDLIVQELFSTEQQYVETLKMLVEVGTELGQVVLSCFLLKRYRQISKLTLLLNL